MKIVFFEVEEWEIGYLQPKIIGHETEFYTTTFENTKSESIYNADMICVFIKTQVNKKMLDKFPNLKLVATMSTGFDHIDLQECRRRGIVACNVPAYGYNTVAEHAFGLILNLTRNIHKAYIRTVQGEFTYQGLIGFDLKGKTLGVLGTGRIGQHVIRMAKGFEMNVLAYDAYSKPELQQQLGFKYVSFDELIRNADIITIHTPLLKETFHLINEESISKMKDGVLIINTARGPIVDTDALVKGLESGKVGGAGLDVLEGEVAIQDEKEMIHSKTHLPREQLQLLLEDHALMSMQNVIITPHLAFYSHEGVQRIMDTTLQNIFDLIEHRGFPNQVNK